LLGILSIIGPNQLDCADICDDLQFFGQMLTPDKESGVNEARERLFL
jgi:hypothetical protein